MDCLPRSCGNGPMLGGKLILIRTRKCAGCNRRIITLADARPGDGDLCHECEQSRLADADVTARRDRAADRAAREKRQR